jgi:hypothetical protein
MGKRQWTTEGQRAWLEGLIPDFSNAQDRKTTAAFFEATYRQWYNKWPNPAPTQDEIEHAKGSFEKVLAEKRKAMESVRVHWPWIRRAIIPYLPWYHQRIKFWFHNHTRGSSSGSGTRSVLKLGPPAKSVQPWQAYLNKYQNTTLKEKIENAWQDYLNTVPGGQKPEKTLFEIRNRVAQEMYKAEGASVKEDVEKHRQTMKHRTKTPNELDKNKSFQQ